MSTLASPFDDIIIFCRMTLLLVLSMHMLPFAQDVVDATLKPVSNGFQKRFWTALTPKGLWHDDTVPVVTALHFLQGSHEWMFEHFFYTAEPDHFHVLDGYALGLYNAVKEGCKRFMEEDHPQDLGPYAEAKLDFRHSDLLRAAHLTMRKNQFILAYIAKSQDRPTRTSPNIYEFAFAIHHWRRQISLHFAYLQWMKRDGAKLLSQAADGTNEAASAAVQVAGESLVGEDYIKYKILSEMPQTFSTMDARMKFRNSKKTKDRCFGFHQCVTILGLNSLKRLVKT